MIHTIVFFDGECGVCNLYVRLLLQLDTRNQFLFSPLNSQFASQYIPGHLLSEDSILVYSSGKIYIKYEAIIEIIFILVPRFRIMEKFLKLKIFILLGNFFYDLFAKYRKKWIKDQCMLIKGTQYENKFLY